MGDNSKRKHGKLAPVTYGRGQTRRFKLQHPDGAMFFPSSEQIEDRPPTVPPRPPRSQKEATMAIEPSQADITELIDVCGMTRDVAIRYLKAKHNDVHAAINAFFDGDDISKDEQGTTWDEGMMAADRDGNSRELRPLGTATAPPSRAPSRNSMHPSTKEEEDRDLQAAMAASQNLPFQQEGGVIRSDGTEAAFGPANKEHYDPSQWAMVRSTAASSEVNPDVDIEHRKNTPGEPRMLKHLPDGDYLPAFLTICHSIAGVRETLLMRNDVRSTYGQDNDWWKGHPISMPLIVHTDSGTPVAPEPDKYDELIAEVQRLMAFLDASDRSYACPGALMQTAAIKESSPATTQSKTMLELFIQEWLIAAHSKRRNQLNLFNTTMTKGDGETTDMTVIDLPVEAGEGERRDLIDIVDSYFWTLGKDNFGNMDAYLDQPAEVIVMRLCQGAASARQLRVEIPDILPVDRYLKENAGVTHGLRAQIKKSREKIRKIDEAVKMLTTRKHPTKNEQLDPRALLKHTFGYFSGQHQHATEKDNMPNGVSAEEANAQPPHYREIADKLEKVMQSIDKKLMLLAAEKEKTKRAIAEMSRSPLPELEGERTPVYRLRGVSTKPNVTYVLHVKDDDEEDLEEIAPGQPQDDNTPAGTQWWRIEYDVNSSPAKVIKTKCPDYDVIRAVELEHSSALVVYASDAVNDIEVKVSELPPALQEFVDRDNGLFREEIRQAAENAALPPYSFQVDGGQVHPSIEGQRASLDSTRPEVSDDEGMPSLDDPSFEGHHAFGMGPDIKQGHYQSQEDPDPVDIRLDDDENMGGTTEMVEKAEREPLIPGLGSGAVDGGDVQMREAEESQDVGEKGAAAHHVEDLAGME